VRNSLRDPRYRAVIARLVEIRNELEISQRELAESLGQSRSFVSKVEIYERRMDFVQLVEWLRALEVDERKFLSEMLKDIPPSRKRR
jgi:transcriptional regulator with XRE-family HTH domain